MAVPRLEFYFEKNLQGDKMKKMLVDGDSIIIDGVELTTEEIKNALVDQLRYRKLSDFLEMQFTEAGVSNE